MGILQIISKSSEPFGNRAEAGRLLACELHKYRDVKAIVLGIPRGGVIIANQIAKSLGVDLDVVLSHKLGAPANPELAIGAVCEDGTVFVDERLAQYVDADADYIEHEKERQLNEIARRVELYRQILGKIDLDGRVVIITDDGVATGATMQAALWAVRQEKPETIILALPVGSEDTVRRLSQAADETVCLKTPSSFDALRRFYMNFSQVEDTQLLEILKEQHKRLRSSWR